jgi:ABC-type Fe3+/spermidine/putrescine transport system ATPase subunit
MLRLEALSKRFGPTVAVDDLSFEVPAGEFLSLLGPSGCGKTTTLRMIAGFESPTSGRIVLDDRDVTRLPPQRRAMGMVFQNYALFPHLDVFENVAFGLRAQGVGSGALREKVDHALARVDLAGYEKRAVQALSGGQHSVWPSRARSRPSPRSSCSTSRYRTWMPLSANELATSSGPS